MMYADELYYKDKYLQGRRPVIGAGFSFYARQASQIIDLYTFGRVALMEQEEVPEAVKLCCCELAEHLFKQVRQAEDTGGKTSERNGTYSVSYGSVQETAQTASREQRGIAMKWLADTGFCYQGV